MSKTIIFCNGKGGVGKSTVTILMAMAIEKSNVQLCVKDLDAQGTTRDSLSEVAPDTLKPQKNPSVTIIDTPGRSELEKLIRELPAADLYIIPTTTTFGDQTVAKKTLELIQKRNPKAEVYLLFNKVKKGTSGASSLTDLVKALGCKRLKNVIHDRVCYQYVQHAGWGELTLEAKEEINALAIEILTK